MGKELEIIYKAIDNINEELDDDSKLDKDRNTIIYSKGSGLDSIDLITFISILEDIVEREHGEYIPLADEKALSNNRNPFKDVKGLEEYLKNIL